MAETGKWAGADAMFSSISEFMFSKNWTVVGAMMVDGDEYAIARFDGQPAHFVVGRLVDMIDGGQVKQRFAIVLEVDVTQAADPAASGDASPVFHIHSVKVRNHPHGRAVAERFREWPGPSCPA